VLIQQNKTIQKKTGKGFAFLVFVIVINLGLIELPPRPLPFSLFVGLGFGAP
jgi:hypothetical protein